MSNKKDYQKIVNSGKLYDEVVVVFPDLVDIHTYTQNSLDWFHIEFENNKDGAEWATIDSLVSSHLPIELDDLKRAKNALIDEKTMSLIFAGYTYDNHTFSLSIHAQRNWIAISTSFEANLSIARKADPLLTQEQAYDAVEASLYPLDVSTLGDLEYTFNTYSDFITFFNGAYTFANGHYMSGRALKNQVNNAVDEAALNLIVDNR